MPDFPPDFPPDLDEMLTAVRADCAARPLPAAEDLRQIGSRRTRQRRMLVTGTVAATVTGVAVAAALVIPGRSPSRQPAGPVVTGNPSASTASALPAGGPPPCHADQLGPNPAIRTGVASEHLGVRVTFTNHGTDPCRLDYLDLLHTEPGLAPARVPTTPSAIAPAPALAPGGQATALIEWTDGYGGYQSSSVPECAHPVHYHGLSVAVSGGTFALPGVTLDVLCGSVSMVWERP